MSVVGISFGNDSTIISVNDRNGFKTVLNEASKRENETVVSFNGNERLFGSSAAQQVVSNYKNTISNLKLLIGRKFSNPDIQNLAKTLPFKISGDANDDIVVHVQYSSEARTFTVVQVLGMYLARMKEMASTERGDNVVDCCISVPAYFTESERRAVYDAAKISGLSPLRLLNETTAAAISWGIFKTDLPENEATHVAIVDCGHVSFTCSIFRFVRGECTTLVHAAERLAGAREFDIALANQVADTLQSSGLDVRSNPKAWLRLVQACEKSKKVLSANPQAPLNVECLMEDRDVHQMLNRDELESVSTGILDRVRATCVRALEIAKLTPDDLKAVELIGGGTRIPCMRQALADVFGETKLMRTMNSDECVAIGCVLQAAMLSPNFRVRQYKVNDVSMYPIRLSWQSDQQDKWNGSDVFVTANPIPSVKQLTFARREPFAVHSCYSDEAAIPEGMERALGVCNVTKVPKQKDDEPAKIKLKVKLDGNGCLSFDQAQITEEIEYEVEEEIPTEESKEKDEKMADAPADGEAKAAEEGAEKKDAEEPKQKKTRKVTKTKLRKSDLPITIDGALGLNAEALNGFRDVERTLQMNDVVVRETAEARNELESYVYDTRSKVSSKYSDWADYVEEGPRESFHSSLNEMEDWLYGDGEDCDKAEYDRQLKKLRDVGDPIAFRVSEFQTRDATADSARKQLQAVKELALSGDEKYAHIAQDEKDGVVADVDAALNWLDTTVATLAAAPKHVMPSTTCADITARAVEIEKKGMAVMNKPKPKEEPKKEEPPKDEKMEDAGEKKEGEEEAAKPAEGDKMDVE